jgi:hypothetical protein
MFFNLGSEKTQSFGFAVIFLWVYVHIYSTLEKPVGLNKKSPIHMYRD